MQSGVADLIAIYESMHSGFISGIDYFDSGAYTAIRHSCNIFTNACVSTHAGCSKSVMCFDAAFSSGCSAFIGMASAAGSGAYNVASTIVTSPFPCDPFQKNVANCAFLNLLYYSPYIINEYIWTIPSGIYSIGNNLLELSIFVSPPRPPVCPWQDLPERQAQASLVYTLTLNIFNGNFLILSEQVFRPLMGTILYAQYNSNAVAANPTLFPSHTVSSRVYPMYLISACCLIKFAIPFVTGFFS